MAWAEEDGSKDGIGSQITFSGSSDEIAAENVKLTAKGLTIKFQLRDKHEPNYERSTEKLQPIVSMISNRRFLGVV